MFAIAKLCLENKQTTPAGIQLHFKSSQEVSVSAALHFKYCCFRFRDLLSIIVFDQEASLLHRAVTISLCHENTFAAPVMMHYSW